MPEKKSNKFSIGKTVKNLLKYEINKGYYNDKTFNLFHEKLKILGKILQKNN